MTGGARNCLRGQPWPLGATPMAWQGRQGVNMAVFSRHATAVYWCLFDANGNEEQRVPLPACTDGIGTVSCPIWKWASCTDCARTGSAARRRSSLQRRQAADRPLRT